MITIDGTNPFHDGWLAGLLGAENLVPNACRRAVDRDAWLEGYRTALETPSVASVRVALLMMRKRGQIRSHGDVVWAEWCSSTTPAGRRA
jgi:hypothetical protein